MSRIASTFAHLRQQGRRALIPFLTAGFPDREHTVPLMHTLVEHGADIIELGVPFSDPMADGPVIQRASEQAIAGGMTLARVFDCVAQFRQQDAHTPVVLMGYANPIEAMGYPTFIAHAQDAGVDGVLTVDYPPQECAEFAAALAAAEIDPIFLLAPTSTEARLHEVAAAGRGYLYYVSLIGVTGAATLDTAAVSARIPAIRAATGLPVAVGFGVRDAASAQKIGAAADGVIIGSRLIEILEAASDAPAMHRAAGEFLGSLRTALDQLHGAAQ